MFLATKLFLPALPAGAVHRDRLYLALNESWAAGARLFLLSAPPGYGKTTLLSAWVQQRGIPCAWVSLEEPDNDPARFFLLVLRALRPFLPGVEGLEQVLKLPQAVDFASLTAEVINAAVSLPEPVLLALDDYHVISAPGVHDLVRLLVEHLPPGLRLAVLTREDPPFPLPRLRARRQMLELRAAQLAFSNGEGQALLDAEGLALGMDQVERVMERTEGWAAGLQLAALSLRGHPDPARLIESFGGSHRFILDYLFSEVFDRLPLDLRSFLCRSAVLGRFNADLCDAALETAGSQAQIEHILKANLFLIALDEERAWFRYHHLTAEILKAEVPQAERQAILQRAAQWLRAHDQPVEAVQYALDARDYHLAVELILSAALPAAESGLLTTTLGWLDALPEDVLRASPDLCVFRAWFLLFAGRFQQAAAWLGQLTTPAAVLPPAAALPRPLAGLLGIMQAWMVSTAGQPLDLARLQGAYAMTEGRYPYFAPMALLAIGQAQRQASDVQGALKSFDEGARLADASSGPVSAMILRNNQAFLLDETGEHQAAMQLCQDNIDRHSAPDGSPGLLAGIPLLPYGCFLYFSGRLDEAYTALTQGINLVRRLGLYDILTAPANHALQYLLADQGRMEEALALNQEVRKRAVKSGLQVVVREADLMAGWLHLQAGDVAPAAHWVQANPAPAAPAAAAGHYTATFIHARVLCASGAWQPASDLLKMVISYTQAAGLLRTWVRASVELALVYRASGQDRAALEVLAPALECAARIDFRQVFRQSAAQLGPLYKELRPRYATFIDQVWSSPEEPKPLARPQTPVLVEPPGERELEILRLVAAGLSNAEIAERLYLTVGTVKWYLNQLFGKLGAGRRTEAVDKARQLGLL